MVYLGEDLLGEVVDELPVDETADAVVNDLLALRVDGPWSIQEAESTWDTVLHCEQAGQVSTGDHTGSKGHKGSPDTVLRIVKRQAGVVE